MLEVKELEILWNQIAKKLLHKRPITTELTDTEAIYEVQIQLLKVVEAIRRGGMIVISENPKFSEVEVRIAKIVVEIMKKGYFKGWDIAGAIAIEIEAELK